MLAHGVSAHPARELPPQSSCWQLLQAQLPPRAGGLYWEFLVQQGPFPKGEAEGGALWLLPLPAASISTHHQGSAAFPCPFSLQNRKNGDSASLQALLGQQEGDVGEVCRVQDPGFDLELPSHLLPIIFPESMAAAQFGGLGRWGVPQYSFPSALHCLLGCAVGILPWQLCRWGWWLWVNTTMPSSLISVQIVAFWVF